MAITCNTPDSIERRSVEFRFNSEREDGISLRRRSSNDIEDCCVNFIMPCCKGLSEWQRQINEDFGEGRYLQGCVKQIGCGAVFAGLAAVTAAFVLAALQNPDDCLEACYTKAGKTICACVL